MKTPNVFTRSDVLRANEALRRQARNAPAGAFHPSESPRPDGVNLTAKEINAAWGRAKKSLASY